MATTRSSKECEVFGAPKDLSLTCLPTYGDVMKFYQHVRITLKTSNKEPTFTDISQIVATKLEDLWKLASIPSVSNYRIIQMLKTYHNKMQSIKKRSKSKRSNSEKNLKEFQDHAKANLFDISACKCDVLESCSCTAERKVPIEERKFLLDQRKHRKMMISSLDVTATKRSMKIFADRVRREKQFTSSEASTSTQKSTINEDDILSSESSSSENVDSDESFAPSKSEQRSFTRRESRNTTNVQVLAEACDRTGISDRAAALIASSVLQDAGVISEETKSSVIDRNKLRRARKRCRSELQAADIVEEPLQSIYFDGRKDKTIKHDIIDSKMYKKTVTEEHIVLMQEPNSHYIGHTSPASGSSANICSSIIDFLQSKNINTNEMIAIGCDGTAVNTGKNGGVIRLLEQNLEKPLQWIVCLLHANELPLRHLIEELDGKSSGPAGYSGTIGKRLSDCEKQPVVQFEVIPSEIIEIDSNELSTDQKYLLEIYRAVSSGNCSQDLSCKNPGKMSHSRWLTTASRILRLYISDEEPSSTLVDIVNYIMKVYIPVWFTIKSKPNFSNGAKHFYKMVLSIQELNERTKIIAAKVVNRNAFFANAENILVGMISDEERHIRELGLRRILKARHSGRPNAQIRQFIVPEINLNSKTYYDIINWQKTTIHEPPVTQNISDDIITNAIETGNNISDLIPKFPCHTQSVERNIKLVTEASSLVSGNQSRDGLIRSRISNRKKIPRFETKSNFNVE